MSSAMKSLFTCPDGGRRCHHSRWIPASVQLVVALLGVLALVAALEAWRAYHQRAVLREIWPLGWSVKFRWHAPDWVRSRASFDAGILLGRVVAVDADDAGIALHELAWTDGLRWCSGLRKHSIDRGLSALQELPDLEVLALNNIQVTDAGLVNLSGLASLRKLSLDNTQVTDRGLVYLKGLSSLRKLSLCGTAVTDEGVSNLKRAIPALQIVR